MTTIFATIENSSYEVTVRKATIIRIEHTDLDSGQKTDVQYDELPYRHREEILLEIIRHLA